MTEIGRRDHWLSMAEPEQPVARMAATKSLALEPAPFMVHAILGEIARRSLRWTVGKRGRIPVPV